MNPRTYIHTALQFLPNLDSQNPADRGLLKADYKGVIDHEDDGDYSSTLELQLGKMFPTRIGLYGEGLIGDEVFNTNAIDWGMGLGVKFMY